MKGKRVIIVSLIVAVVIFSLSVLFIVKGVYDYNNKILIDKDTHTLRVNFDRDIKILQLADVQIINENDANNAFSTVENLVEKTKPDLIVLTGDNVSDGSTEEIFNRYVKFMDSFKIPWAPVFGNHDYNSAVTPERQAELYTSSKYCLFIKGTIDNSYGNYYYNVVRKGTLEYSLIFMDSGKDFRVEHVAWYENVINEVKEQNCDKGLPSIAFFHIPTVETELARQMVESGEIQASGEVNETVCYQAVNVGLFAKAKELGSTKAFVYGHDHVNTLIVEYQGIKLCYGLKSGATSYFDNRLIGGNVYIIKPDCSFTVDRIFV